MNLVSQLSFTVLFMTLTAYSWPMSGTEAATECKVESIPDKVVVTTIETWPFFRQSRERGTEVCVRSEGFIPDLMGKIADMVGFEYEFQIVKDGKYGTKLDDGTWSGMVGEVMRKEADLAAAPLTTFSTRMEVVDFTTPFLQSGLVVVYKKSTLGEYPFHNAKELLDSGITFGITNGGSTMNMFKNTQEETLHRMWLSMRRQGSSSFLSSAAEGIAKVRQGNFAFIMEKEFAESTARSLPCDLDIVIDNLLPREFGMATRQGSALRGAISKAILTLQETGIIRQLYNKYWEDKCQDA